MYLNKYEVVQNMKRNAWFRVTYGYHSKHLLYIYKYVYIDIYVYIYIYIYLPSFPQISIRKKNKNQPG